MMVHGNKAYLNCLTRQEAQKLLWNKLNAVGYFDNLPVESVPVHLALGRVTAYSVYAKQSLPHYNGAAMDGIAVLAQDTFGAHETFPKRFSMLSAFQPFSAGCCYLVDTGDMMPFGANAVIMIENVHIDEGNAEITAAASPWQHVRIIGEDIVANELVIPEFHIVTPIDIAAMLAAGLEWVDIIQKPKVTIIPTGDELVGTCHELIPGKILDVNSPDAGCAYELAVNRCLIPLFTIIIWT